ncbi:MAG: acetolactate synthase 3 large subunit [Gammaproteobacteria bacterium]|nr:acetolactate synthase 3 large subunit [Gammaproteobacteria bacterium]MCW8910699.1 acetolactate synthase 3 large subunit [Gammaproteobacteria bacterium]MCW9005305.1 acetolactate synthase 3 large subunit [Gammaproteobacteria bacterium]MCW9056653.1 acetolactate synthase 3 large subunit [Gammaproteobacteria bacterium]
MELTGAEIIVQSLIEEGIDHVFGYPGGAVLHIYDAFYKQDKIKHVLVRHEQAATHAADGYARSTGKPGVVLVTSGPGATNAVTGIATAYMDSIPMVVLTGQVPKPLIGNDAFQEVDSVGITRPVVKHNFLVEDVKDLALILKKAFYVATTGRPGPVVVDIPKDITAHKTEFHYPREIKMRSYHPTIKGHSGQVKKALDIILDAKKPMIYTGGGVILSNASEDLVAFTQTLGAPVTNTLMGLGAYPSSDRQFVGMLGMHGTYEANMSMHNCDVLIAIGARFDDRVTGNLEKFCPDATIVHVDVDPASISKNVRVDVPIVGDVKQVLTEFNQQLTKNERRPDAAALESWWQQINEWRAQNCLKYDHDTGTIKPQFVVEQLHEVTKGDAFVASDVGQHQMFAAQYYGFDKPRRWINSGGLGTMGFGLPAAMGVQFAHPDETVVCITGEGSIQMCIQELATCLQYGLPLKIINLNNRYLGMVRQWQEFFYEKRYSMSYMDSLPDFVKLAEAYGHVGIQVTKPEDVRQALDDAMNKYKDRLVFIDFLTDREENVYPMIPAGAGLNEMILI